MSNDDLINKSKVFCILPWIHMHMLPNAKVLPCCVWPYDKPLSDASVSSLSEIWNSDGYKTLRLDMLKGQSTENCRHCYEVDGARGMSTRVSKNQRFAHLLDQAIASTKPDGSVEKINMAYFDVRFSNICNFKCRGCSVELSSAWYNDHEKLYNFKSDKPKYFSIDSYPNIWEELMTYIDTVEVAYFAGGEPLIMDDHYRVLDELIKRKKTAVTLSYNSNLSKIKYKDKNICDYWNQFQYVYMGVSIDDIEKRGEYFRHGMNWDKTLENIQYIKEHSPHVKFNVNCTINAMNVLYVTEIHQRLIEEKIIEPHEFTLNLLIDPEELRTRILPSELKGIATSKIKRYMLDYLSFGWSQHSILHMNSVFVSILQYMNQEDESNLIPQFIDRTKKLDMIRGESYKDIFPELAKYIPID
jgi:sulfatase maturation enzyme AslB (radical SAM superfamily)